MDGDGYMCDDDDDDEEEEEDRDYDYDRDEIQCMLVDWCASQRFSSQACKVRLYVRCKLSCLFLITLFRHMSGLGNVLMFPASTPWPSGLAVRESQARHSLLGGTCDGTP